MAVNEFLRSVSSRGQVTIPLEVGRRLGIRPKDKAAFLLEDGRVMLAPAVSLDGICQSVSVLKPPRTWYEATDLAAEEHARHAARVGLPEC